MSQNTTNLQIQADEHVSALDFRLDILRITFSIENILEDIIERTFKGSGQIKKQNQVPEAEFMTFFIKKEDYISFKEWWKDKKIFSSIWNKKANGAVFVNIKNLINNNSFGGLIKLLESLSYIKLKKIYSEIYKDLEIKTFRKWLNFIKDIRNLLAHRTNINPKTFFEKASMPGNSNKLQTKRLDSLKHKIFVLEYLLHEQIKDKKIAAIFKKYNFLEK